MSVSGYSLKNIFISAGVAVLVIALVVTCMVLRSLQMTEYETLPSPDARYKIVIYRRPLLLGAMPGQAGDARDLFVFMTGRESYCTNRKLKWCRRTAIFDGKRMRSICPLNSGGNYPSNCDNIDRT